MYTTTTRNRRNANSPLYTACHMALCIVATVGCLVLLAQASVLLATNPVLACCTVVTALYLGFTSTR